MSGCRALDWIMEARLLRLALFMLIALVVSGGQIVSRAQVVHPSVYVVTIEGVIDLGWAPYVNRALRRRVALWQ